MYFIVNPDGLKKVLNYILHLKYNFTDQNPTSKLHTSERERKEHKNRKKVRRKYQTEDKDLINNNLLENVSKILENVENNNLDAINKRLDRFKQEIQVSRISELPNGFYAKDVESGPWYLEELDEDIPEDFKYLILEKGKFRTSKGVHQAEIKGYVEELDDDYDFHIFE